MRLRLRVYAYRVRATMWLKNLARPRTRCTMTSTEEVVCENRDPDELRAFDIEFLAILMLTRERDIPCPACRGLRYDRAGTGTTAMSFRVCPA